MSSLTKKPFIYASSVTQKKKKKRQLDKNKSDLDKNKVYFCFQRTTKTNGIEEKHEENSRRQVMKGARFLSFFLFLLLFLFHLCGPLVLAYLPIATTATAAKVCRINHFIF